MSADSRPLPASRPTWLKLLIGFAFLIVAFNIGVFIYGKTLPGTWSVEETVAIAAPPDEVYPLVSTPKRWPEWTTWNKERDPSVEFQSEGPESGKDAWFAWQGNQLGFGKLTIVEAEPNSSVAYHLRLGGGDFSKNGRIRLEPTDAGTQVTWTDGGELDGTLGRIFGDRLRNAVSADFAASLAKLKTVVETRPAAPP